MKRWVFPPLLATLLTSSQLLINVDVSVAVSNVQAPTTNLPRHRVILTAEAYRRCVWFCASNNMGPCAGHMNDQFAAGQIHEGMAYWLTGWDSLAGFETSLSQGRMAGCRWDSCANVTCAAGIDCSGFVSRCWEQTQKYYTYNLHEISTSYGSRDHDYLVPRMKAGDIFNHPGDHVVLLYRFKNNPTKDPIFYESTGSKWPYKTWLNIEDGWQLI